MTYTDVAAMLEELELPIAYDHFAEGESPDPPFICYLYPESIPFGADNIVYFQFHELDIELYTDIKDPALEKRVETLLSAHELFFQKNEAWIDEEKLYEVLYTVIVDVEDEEREEPDHE